MEKNYNSNEKPTSKKKVIGLPFRYILIFNSFLAFIIVYANKVVLSVAIVAMVSEPTAHFSSNHSINKTLNSINNTLTNENANLTEPSFSALKSIPSSVLKLNDNNQTFNSQSNKSIRQMKKNQVYYDHATRSKVLGAFFWGYIVTQVPAGRLAERFGAKWLLGISMFLCSLMSFLIPIATLSEKDFAQSPSQFVIKINNFMTSLLGAGWALQLIRMAQGVCAGVAHPCMHALITRWTPKTERSMTTAFIYSGSQIGTVFIMPVTGFLASSNFLDGWPSVFYLLGILGTVWFILWCIFVYDTPDKHPFISNEELQNLKIGIGDEISNDNHDIPWKKVFTSWPVYALIFAHFGQNFGYFMLLTELPTYLKEALHFNIKENGLISSLPYLVQAFTSWISSYISDRIVKSERYPISWVRKGFNSAGFYGPALCFVVIAFAGKSTMVVILSLVFSLGLNGFAMSGFHVTHVDMAPDFAGTLMGITNGISNFNGIIAPFIVTALTDKNGETEWGSVFLIACAVYIITNTIYCWFGTSKLQSWARSSKNEVINVFVCNNENNLINGNLKKDVYLLTDIKNSSYNSSNGSKQELKNDINTNGKTNES